MNAYWFHKEDGTKTEFSACGVCGKLARGESNYDISEKCCTCYDCGLPLSKEERGYANPKLYHRACEDKRRAEREAKKLEEAALVEGYKDPVFCEAVSGGWGDGYWADVDELAEALDDEENDDDRPEFAHCCTGHVAQLDIGQILERLTEDMHEEASDSLDGTAELEAAINAFNAANDQAISWCLDSKRKVTIPARNSARNSH